MTRALRQPLVTLPILGIFVAALVLALVLFLPSAEGSSHTYGLAWSAPAGSSDSYQYSADHGLTWNDLQQGSHAGITAPSSGSASVFLVRAVAGTTRSSTVLPTPTPGRAEQRSATPTPVPPTPVPTVAPTPSGGASGASQTATPTTPVLTATPSEVDALLTWTASTMAGGTLAWYELDYTTTSGGAWSQLARVDANHALRHVDPYISTGVTHWYRVRAQFTDGTYSAWSATVSATGLAEEPPYTPVMTALVLNAYEIRLTWTEDKAARVNNQSYRYFVEKQIDGDWWHLAEVAVREGVTPEYTDYGLDAASTHTYRVRVQDIGHDYGGWSDSVTATTNHVSPQDPYAMATPAGVDGIYVEWEIPTIGSSAITKQELHASSTSGASWQVLNSNVPAGTLSYLHTGLTDGAEWWYRVRVTNIAGTTNWAVTNAKVGDRPVSLAPGLSVAENGSALIEIDWTAPVDTGGLDVRAYELFCLEDPSDPVHDQCDGYPYTSDHWMYSLTDEHLDGGTFRTYRVRAWTDNGAGLWSPWRSATTVSGAPDAPQNFALAADGENAVDASWDAPAGSVALSGYILERREVDVTEEWTEVARLPASATSYEDTGLWRGTLYSYRVVAYNSNGKGRYSWDEWVYTEGPSPTTPERVSIVYAASLTSTSFTARWDAPDDGGRPIERYHYRFQDGCDSPERSGTTTGTSAAFTGLSCNDGNFWVWAENAIGENPDSSDVFVGFPNRGGSLGVSTTAISLHEGGATTYTLRLSSAPSTGKELWLYFSGDGDEGILQQAFHQHQAHKFTADNWNTPVVVTLEAPEDNNDVTEVAVIRHLLVTDLPPLAPGETRDPADFDARWHGVTSDGVRVEFRDND